MQLDICLMLESYNRFGRSVSRFTNSSVTHWMVTFVVTGLLERVSWNVIRNHLFECLWDLLEVVYFSISAHLYSGRHPTGH